MMKSDMIENILEFDKKVYRVDWISGPDKWVSKKLTKAEKENVPKNKELIKYEDVPEKLLKFFPSYKKGRKDASWDYETTREEWHKLCKSICNNLASVFGAKVIVADKAEADDVAKVYADMNAANEMVFITTDSDWTQLLVDHLFLGLFNPGKREWSTVNVTEAEHALAVKLIGGDASDAVPGISLMGDNATLGPKKSEALVIEYGIPGVYDYLEATADKPGLNRNYELIYLDNIPREISILIERILKTAKPSKSKKPLNYTSFGITKKDELGIKAEAKSLRDMDLEDNMVEE